MWEFMIPSSHALRRTSSGQVPSRSNSQATGRISLAAKSCVISRSAFCSSVKVKSTTVRLLGGRLTGQSTRRKGTRLRVARPPPGHPSTVQGEDHGGDPDGDGQERQNGQRDLLRIEHRAPGGHGPTPDTSPDRHTHSVQEDLVVVIFVVVLVAAIAALASLANRGHLYDQIGRGGLSLRDERDRRPAPAAGPP